MQEWILPFIGGLILGAVLGTFIGVYPTLLLVSTHGVVLLLVIDTLLGVLGGALLSWKINTRKAYTGLKGRFLRFPQGGLYVQIALKRMGSLVGGEE